DLLLPLVRIEGLVLVYAEGQQHAVEEVVPRLGPFRSEDVMEILPVAQIVRLRRLPVLATDRNEFRRWRSRAVIVGVKLILAREGLGGTLIATQAPRRKPNLIRRRTPDDELRIDHVRTVGRQNEVFAALSLVRACLANIRDRPLPHI